MKKIVFISIVMLFIIQQLYSVDTNAVKYFPLGVGNIYVYYHSHTSYPPLVTQYSIYSGRVISEIVIAGKKYFNLIGFPKYASGLYRVDTTMGSLLKYDSSNTCSYYISERFIDSLAAELGNTIKFCGILYPPIESFICSELSPFTIFGINSIKKAFQYDLSNIVSNHHVTRYSMNFGMYFYYYYSSYQGVWDKDTFSLKGCVINGVLYGDTSTILGVKGINNSFPHSFNLFQNYPNPFNPVTKIQFDIAKSSLTRLIIYDLLGREVATLVNEELRPGTYETEWEASAFSSGIYFYKLITNDFIETKKLVLVK